MRKRTTIYEKKTLVGRFWNKFNNGLVSWLCQTRYYLQLILQLRCCLVIIQEVVLPCISQPGNLSLLQHAAPTPIYWTLSGRSTDVSITLTKQKLLHVKRI